MRIVVAIAGAVLAWCAFLLAPIASGDGWLALVLCPPFATGALVAAIAMSSRRRVRRVLIGAIDVLMMLTAVLYGAVGLLFVLPGLITVLLYGGWFVIARRGDGDERGASIALATGALWAIVFALPAARTSSRCAHLAFGASVVMVFAGLGWLREVERMRRERTEPPRAVVR